MNPPPSAQRLLEAVVPICRSGDRGGRSGGRVRAPVRYRTTAGTVRMRIRKRTQGQDADHGQEGALTRLPHRAGHVLPHTTEQ